MFGYYVVKPAKIQTARFPSNVNIVPKGNTDSRSNVRWSLPTMKLLKIFLEVQYTVTFDRIMYFRSKN
jgi:hypothetical protein